MSSYVADDVIVVLPYDVAVDPSYTTSACPVVNDSPWTLFKYNVLLPFNAVTVIVASRPWRTLLVVIPKTSPTTYPEPPVLLVKLIDDICPELFVLTVAVAPVPLPLIAYNGTLLYAWLGLNPTPAFDTLKVLTVS